MNFDDFQASFVKENRKLRLALIFTLLVSSIGTVTAFTQRRYFLYRGNDILEERPLIEEVCKLSFTSIVEGGPNESIIEGEILDLIKKDPFSMPVEKILLLKSSEENTCKIILKSNGKLLAFKVSMSASDSNPFYYKLASIDEFYLNKGEL